MAIPTDIKQLIIEIVDQVPKRNLKSLLLGLLQKLLESPDFGALQKQKIARIYAAIKVIMEE